MKNNLFIIISSFIILVLIFLCAITLSSKPTYSYVSYDKFTNIESGLVYFGNLDSDVKKVLKKFDSNFTIKEYVVKEYDIDTLNSYLESFNLSKVEENGFVFINETIPVWSSNKSFNEKELSEEINYQINGTLKSKDILYKTPEKIDDLISLINSKKYTVIVLAKKDCTYCTLFQPVINNIVKEYGIDIYYLDKTKYSNNEFQKFKDLDLSIKESCTTSGKATTTKSFSSYPLFLITKKGESVDCLLGYQSEDDIIELLLKYNIIK